jgi:hypothetical protein
MFRSTSSSTAGVLSCRSNASEQIKTQDLTEATAEDGLAEQHDGHLATPTKIRYSRSNTATSPLPNPKSKKMISWLFRT